MYDPNVDRLRKQYDPGPVTRTGIYSKNKQHREGLGDVHFVGLRKHSLGTTWYI